MFPLTVSALLFSALSLINAAPAGPSPVDNLARDRATLQTFLKTLSPNSNNLAANWTGTDVCRWDGITCAERPDGVKAVAGIDFNQFQLTSSSGELPLTGLLDKLLDITFFHANSNGFTGSVPDVSALKYLYELDFSNNKLSGPFPKSVFGAPLTILDLRFNNFDGPLPQEIFTQTEMDLIFLNDNKFSGPIPETGNIKTIYITLANNQLTGPIPTSLAKNKSLKELLLLGNNLEGNVPEELCALPLDVLDVSKNPKLSGVLAPKCVELLNKKVLNITGTALSVPPKRAASL